MEDAYASTRKAIPGDIEPPAKSIHMVSEEIKPPAALEEPEAEEQPGEEPAPPEEPVQPAEPEEDSTQEEN